ncbi:hypothetical protein [Streptomyces roseicoloratus]|uniref:hypothetical protein n=1 Tax=Streptomyces roseicoloratus TaxID=2508722 RepID=UPI001009A7FC|nr:hypothetical protein [Streptomyces roseicoloratus]
MSRLRALVWRATRRTTNRLYDALAVLGGYCNDHPVKSGIPDGTGGYHHWRCAFKRGHTGHHRYRNYTWDANGTTDYLPIDPFPSQPWERSSISTRRQARERRRWDADQSARFRAERLARGEKY